MMIHRMGIYGVALAVLAACEAPIAREPDIQVMGSAQIEKPAEVFRIDAQIVERDLDPVAALSAASTKLEAITSGISGLPGLTSYGISADAAEASIDRPSGCEVGNQYYGNTPRPIDCSPIEAAAVLSFTVEGTPAEAAGAAIAYLTQAQVETAALREFDIADRAAAELEVKQAALADAMSTAQALADQAGVTIASPSSIRYGNEVYFNQDIVRQSDRVVVTGSSGPPPPAALEVSLDLSPRPVSFNANVAVIFRLEKAVE